MTLSNQVRAGRCQQAITAYSDDDTYTNLVDFLADAMHYCHVNGDSFRDALDTAVMHFEAEISGDDISDDLNQEVTNERTQTMPPNDDIDIDALLADRKQIALIWSIEDVQTVRPDLTDEQAWEVLQQVKNDHDATLGVTWDTLEWAAKDLFGNAPKTGDA
jgi:hypothetical protein